MVSGTGVFLVQVKCPLYVTRVSSMSAADAIKNRKPKGQKVYGETLASALGISGKANKKSPLFVTSPPIRFNQETKSHLFTLLAS